MRTERGRDVLILYSRSEEIFHMVTHIVGGAFSVAVTALCVIRAAVHHSAYSVIAAAVFGALMITYYCMSAIYHGLRPRREAKTVFARLTACAMFCMIAGTYTSLAFFILESGRLAIGWSLFGIWWGIAVMGVLFNALAGEKYKLLTLILYMVMWWSAVGALFIPALSTALGAGGICLLLFGAAAYTAGAFLYLFDQKHDYLHALAHLFVIAGSLLQSLCILFYLV